MKDPGHFDANVVAVTAGKHVVVALAEEGRGIQQAGLIDDLEASESILAAPVEQFRSSFDRVSDLASAT